MHFNTAFVMPSGFCRLYVNVPQAASALFLLFSFAIFAACSSARKPLHDAEIQKKWIRSTAEILKNLTREYNPTVAPHAAGKPVVVNLTFEVLTFGEIDEANMEFSLDMYFHQYWEDVRLAQGQDRTIPLSGPAIYSIWIPDTYIVNAKKLNIHDVVLENQMVKIYPDGKVQHMARISVTAHCRVELSLYPLDRQTCDLVLESFSLTKEALVYKWKGNETNKCTVGVFDAEMAQFDYRGVSLLETHEKLTTPGYSDVYARFVFDRRVKYMIIRSYLPSYLITFISFVGFWIPKNAVPARVALGITTILTIVYFLSAVDARMPHVSYMKAIDYHMFVSFGFIFASLLEYVIVLNIPIKSDRVCIHGHNECHENRASEEDERQPTEVGQDRKAQQDFELRCRGKKSSGSYDVTPSNIDVTNHCFVCSCLILRKNNGIHKVHPLDKYSRVLFPLGYLILVVVYWVVYMVMNEQNTEPNEGHVLC